LPSTPLPIPSRAPALPPPPFSALWEHPLSTVLPSSSGSTAYDAGGVIADLTVGSGPEDSAYDSANGDVYVTNYDGATVSVISGATNTIVATVTVGSGPVGAAYDAGNGDVYVANYFSATVSVISGATNTVVATPSVGSDPQAVEYDSGNGDVYVANYLGGTVSVISGTTNTVVTTLTVGSHPQTVTYNSGDGDLYVANYGGNTVTVIDGALNAVTYSPTVGNSPYGIAYDSANGDMYVSNYGSSTVSVIAGGTAAVIATIPVGGGPGAIVYDNANGDVYVANYGSSSASVIDGTTNVVAATLTLGEGPVGMTYDSANGDVYVTNYYADTVSVISGATNGVVATIGVGEEAEVLTYDSGNGDLYVSNYFSDSVSVISTELGVGSLTSELLGTPVSGSELVNTITGLSSPVGGVFDPDNGYLYEGVSGLDAVAVIDPATGGVLGVIDVCNGLQDLAYDSWNGEVYVPCFYSDQADVINTANDAVSAVPLGGSSAPEGVAFDPSNGEVYVADFGANTVSAISGLTNTVVATIDVGDGPAGVAYDSANGNIYVADSNAVTLSVISGVSNTVVATPDIGNVPGFLAYDPGNGDLYVSMPYVSEVYVVDATDYAVTAQVSGISEPEFPTYASANGDVYVTNAASNEVAVINGTTNLLATVLSVAATPEGLVFDSTNAVVYVAEGSINSLAEVATVSSPVSSPAPSMDVGQSLTLSAAVLGLGAPGDLFSISASPTTGLACAADPYGQTVATGACLASAAGSYTVTFTLQDELGTLVSTSETVTVLADPMVSTPTASPTSVDVGQSTTLSVSAAGGAGGYSYTWHNLPGGCSSSNLPSISCAPDVFSAFPSSVYVNVTDSNGFEVTSGTLSLTVYGSVYVLEPTASVGAVDVGQSVVFTLDPGGGTGVFAITWTGLPDGCNSVNSITLSCTPTSTVGSPISVSATAVDTNGESGTSYPTLSFAVSPDPTIQAITPSRSALDVGQVLTLSTSATGGSGSPVYSWSGLPTGCLSRSSLSISCSPTASGTFTATVSVRDSNGMNVTSSSSVIVVSPLPSFTSPVGASRASLDVGQTTILSTSGTTGSGALQFSWTGLPTGCAGGPSWSISCVPTGTGTFSSGSLAITDSNGGTATLAFALTLTVSADPTIQGITASRGTLDVTQALTLTTTATSGSGSPTYSWSDLPAGCASASALSISCNPSATGTYTVTAEVVDSNGFTAVSTSTVLVVSALPTITGLSRSTGTLDVGQSLVLTGAGSAGSGGLQFAWSGLPTGCSGSASWSITCVPTGTGTFAVIDLTVTDSNGGTAAWSPALTVTVSADPTITTPTATLAALDVSQTSILAATAAAPAGSPTYAWSGLPSGCTGTATLTVTCTPTTGSEGTYTVTVTVTDANGGSATSGSVTLTVSSLPSVTAIAPTTTTLDVGQGLGVNAAGSSGSGGLTYSWSGLPAGCPSQSSWTLSCTPSAAGVFSSITLSVTDSNGGTASLSVTGTVTVFADPSITTPTAAPASLDVGQTTVVSASANAPAGGPTYLWTGLPAGCVGTATLTVTCTPGVGTAGSYGISVSVTDGNGERATSGTLLLVVSPLPTITSLSASRSSLDAGQVTTLAAVGTSGNGGLQFSWAGLPAGCSSSNAWSFACAPSAAGTFPVLLSVTDSNGGSATWTTPATLTVSADPSASTPTSLPGSVDAGQTTTLAAHATPGSGTDTYAWWGLPAGCLSADHVSISCTPATAGSYSVGYTIQDSNGVNVTSGASVLTVASALAVPTLTASAAALDVGSSTTLVASVSGGASPYSYQWTGLPAGCASANAPSLLCTPSSAGTATVTVTVTDANAASQTSTSTTLTVLAAPSVGAPSATLSSLDVGQTTSLTVTAVVGTATSTLTWYGLPAGCASSSASTISCTPTAAGVYSVWATVKDANEVVATSSPLTLSVTTALGVASLTPATLSADVGQTLSFAAGISGGSGGYQYAWSGLPAGCVAADQSSVTCTPTAAGTSTVKVTVTDSNGASASATSSLTVSAALTVSVSASPASAASGTTLTFTATASGGTGTPTYAWYLNGSLVASSTGTTLTVTSAGAGTYTVWVAVSDSVGARVASAPVSVLVSAPPSTTTPSSSSTSVTAQVSPLEEGALVGMLVLLAVIAVLLIALLITRPRPPTSSGTQGAEAPRADRRAAAKPRETVSPSSAPSGASADMDDYHEN
jgi:YVTN family beta-propeller protein